MKWVNKKIEERNKEMKIGLREKKKVEDIAEEEEGAGTSKNGEREKG